MGPSQNDYTHTHHMSSCVEGLRPTTQQTTQQLPLPSVHPFDGLWGLCYLPANRAVRRSSGVVIVIAIFILPRFASCDHSFSFSPCAGGEDLPSPSRRRHEGWRCTDLTLFNDHESAEIHSRDENGRDFHRK